jgi:uncharacterized protein
MDAVESDAEPRQCIAFSGTELIARGAIGEVAVAAKRVAESDPLAAILFFDESSSEAIEMDLRGSEGEVARRYGAYLTSNSSSPNPFPSEPSASLAARGPGRPKLGVVAREVTLLPRHWEWLAKQPGGASVALRRLVEEARKSSVETDRRRSAQESAYRFMSAIAGDRSGFEEATRALFAGDSSRFVEITNEWPTDIRAHARRLAEVAFGES